MADAAEISDIIRETAPPIFAKSATAAQIREWVARNATQPVIEARLRDPAYVVLLASVSRSGAPEATGYVRFDRASDARGMAYIGGVYSRRRGQGLGRALLTALISDAVAHECQQVGMTVGVDNLVMTNLACQLGFVAEPPEDDRTGILRDARFSEYTLPLRDRTD